MTGRLSPLLLTFRGYRNERWRQQERGEAARPHAIHCSWSPLPKGTHGRSRAVAKEGQQGEPGPDRTPQAREVADGVVFTRRFRRSRPGSSITHGLAQGQQAAGCQARPRHAPVRSPQGLLCRECRAGRPSRRPVWPWTAGVGCPWSHGGSGAWTPGRQEEKSRARFPRNRGAVKGWRQDEVASRGQRAAEKPLFRRRWQCHV